MGFVKVLGMLAALGLIVAATACGAAAASAPLIVKVQDTLDGAWMLGSPFYEDFREDSSVKVQDTLDGAWMLGSPFYEDFQS